MRSGDTNAAVTVNYAVTGTASAGGDYAALSGGVTLLAGATATNIFVTPIADNLVEGDETLTLTLQPSANYTLTTLSNATVVILDRPADDWRKTNFTSLELADATISGDLADPDHDGLPNLMEYTLGMNPKVADVNAFSPRFEGGFFADLHPRESRGGRFARGGNFN